ncbi:unnamed protein product, partial [Amoebophrya sp. A120]
PSPDLKWPISESKKVPPSGTPLEGGPWVPPVAFVEFWPALFVNEPPSQLRQRRNTCAADARLPFLLEKESRLVRADRLAEMGRAATSRNADKSSRPAATPWEGGARFLMYFWNFPCLIPVCVPAK